MTEIIANVTATRASVASARWAIEAGRAGGGDVHLMRIIPKTAELAPKDEDWYRQQIEAKLARWVSRHRLDPTSTSVIVGNPITELVAVSRARQASMVVVGVRRGHGFARPLVRQLAQPLVMVPERDFDSTAKDIVVGIDGSDGSACALRWALSLAERTGWKVRAIHVASGRSTLFEAEQWTEQHVGNSTAIVSVESTREKGSNPAAVLTERSVKGGASLLVAAAKGRRSLSGALLGRIPLQLLDRPELPVAVVPRSMFVAEQWGGPAGV